MAHQSRDNGRGVSTVALIGPDGTGKTTISKALVASNLVPMKYLYMGLNIESSNLALPTSRLIYWLKVQAYKRSLRRSGRPVPQDVNLHGVEHRSDRRGKIGGVGRLLFRLSEETFRQIASWMYQRRGYLVIYDRHFIFDVVPRPSEQREPRRLTDRIHNWFLLNLYPRPDLVILLDAAPDVLYARKQEVPPSYLERDRQAFSEKRSYARDWLEVDASQPLDVVIAGISRAIIDRRPARVP